MSYEFLNDLNKEQYEAATFKDGYELILAGAGTGKTKTLISRVAYLLDAGIPASNILLLTFTRAAADEMKNRIITMIGNKGKAITSKTFHGWCFTFLQIHGFEINRPNIKPLPEGDAKDLMEPIRKDMIHKLKNNEHVDYKAFPKTEKILECHSYEVEQMTDINTAVYAKMDSFQNEIITVLNQYEQAKIEENRMDFDDLLKYTYIILKDNPQIRQKYNNLYQYVMCDEYQDTDLIQNHILEYITNLRGNLVVVGDDDQSIYKFRNARIENILDFSKNHPNTKQIKLERNYRSTQEILNVANAVMTYKTEGEQKVLYNYKNGETPIYLNIENERNEAKAIVKYIQQRHIDGLPYNNISILMRQNKLTAPIEAELQSKDIPYIVHGGKSFFEKTVIRDILSILRILIDMDKIALKRILTIIYGIGKETAEAIEKDIIENGFETIFMNNKYKSKPYFPQLTYIADLFINLKNKSLQYILDDLIHKNSYIKIRQNVDVAKESKKIIVNRQDKEHQKINKEIIMADTLCNLAKDYTSIKTFYNDLFVDTNPTQSEKKDRVSLSTIHYAKGLEYDTVILVGAREGILPSAPYKNENPYEALSEELRCLYVALTRAKNNLIITMPTYETTYGYNGLEQNVAIPSRFLQHQDVMDCLIQKDNYIS